jgi:hypothetical protein
MMNLKRLFIFECFLGLLALAAYSSASQTSVEANATLVGRAILPAKTFAEGPTSGTQIGKAAINGVSVPFVNQQPVQGFSAVLDNKDGSFLVMSDNGFGKLENSADYHLRVYTIRPDFKTKTGGTGKITVNGFVELRDPNRLVPFAITQKLTSKRILTGADFDIESFQRAHDGTFWFGDEFGPFLLHTDAQGIVLEPPIPLPNFNNPNQEIRSPQNPYNEKGVCAQTSGGFEGMAITPDGKKLLTLLEKPLKKACRWLTKEGLLLMHEFDIVNRKYTGKHYFYQLHPRGTAIGDFILFTHKQGLVIERDNSQGDMQGFKRIYKITLKANGEMVEKQPLVNLLKIADPNGISQGQSGDIGIGKTFGFPFVTIESVVVLGNHQIGVLNDNNYPFSVGRHVGSGQPDDNEFIIIELDEDILR